MAEELLEHRGAIPEPYIKLDTYHTDLAATVGDTAEPRRLRPVGKL